MIKHKFDPVSGGHYWTVFEGTVARTLNLADDLNVDLDGEGRLLGVELLRPTVPPVIGGTGTATWTDAR